MSDEVTIALGVAGIAGTLLGVLVGSALAESATERRRKADACHEIEAIYLETATHMAYAEVERAGGANAPPLREDIEVDGYRAMAQVGAASRRLRAATDQLAGRMQAAIASQGSPDPAARQAGRDSAMDVVQAFRDLADAELAQRWWAPWRRGAIGRAERALASATAQPGAHRTA